MLANHDPTKSWNTMHFIWERNRHGRSDYSSISDYIDVESLNAYKLPPYGGCTEKEAFRRIKSKIS